VAIEASTDAGEQRLIDSYGPSIDDLISGAEEISARLIAARSFPADPRKRAGG